MKVLPFKIPKKEKEALVYQEDREMVFYDQLHQHEEIQITYLVKGSGTLIVGDTISNFAGGDIFVIGSNVPHVFRSDTDQKEVSLMYSLFFSRAGFGKDFFMLPDLSATESFFKASDYGMRILSEKETLIRMFHQLKDQNKLEQVASLLNILNIIIAAEKYPLSTFVYRKKYTDDEGKRMNAVVELAIKHYHENIELEAVAEKANMSKNAFCRYFKKRTNKTYFQFLIEIRIENACKLLYNQPEVSVASISEMVGFQNIANFNRKFKELKGVTPTQFRLQYEHTRP